MHNSIHTKLNEYLSANLHNIKTLVSKNDKPFLMYHGGSFSSGEFKGTGWFTRCKSDATYYAKQNGGTVTKAYLVIENPLYSGDVEFMNIEITNDIIVSATNRNILNGIKINNGIISFIETNAAVLIAQDINRDGVIDLLDGEILDAVVFSNEQIIIK